MRHTGRIRARFESLARKTALYVLAAAIWAVVLCEPAGAPLAGPVVAARPMGLHDAGTRALHEREGELGGPASRSAPAGRSMPAGEAVPAGPAAPEVVWPALGVLTGWFGEGRSEHRHPGIDIDGATGDEVVAAAAGRVVVAGPAPAGYAGYGTVVIIDHGDGLVSISAHLSRVVVRAGDTVAPGQGVGSVGTSGTVTGSHLHFELRRRGAAVDPRSWLPRR